LFFFRSIIIGREAGKINILRAVKPNVSNMLEQKGETMGRKKGKGFRYSEVLPSLTVMELRKLADIVRANKGKREKGGKYRRLRKDELVQEIRRAAANTFPNISLRANEYIESVTFDTKLR
jgi:hypothetical protein